ncbi:MAG: hypothetical protein KDB22_04570 [Planctomycetales bacterium]|nr:hypothetical protein [Planctomycetales bacterium]
MSMATPVEKIRSAVASQLSSFGVKDPGTIHESILIRNGLFCGRKFKCEGYDVVWFLEEDEIKFFGPCGDLLSTLSAVACIQKYEQEARPTDERRAA